MDLQAMVDGWNKRESEARGAMPDRWTLGTLVDALERMNPDAVVLGLDAPDGGSDPELVFDSYRGYYTDLAIEPGEHHMRARNLLLLARNALGHVFTGYKGGDFPMHRRSPLWLSQYGTASGLRVCGMCEVSPGEFAFLVADDKGGRDAAPSPHRMLRADA